ncbi:DUF2891 family protein [Nannocystis sp.]|uniref:DUF2891 family protein n=1 Tax=Nannocystis sp. TaxID=1962667 RepID=UPI0024272C75|nr:DUF2891 family protein [Nannocystis sp.]MBK7824991.1 DUF2891 family protein [Nannocystis sp.]MBK9752763.1 DUF2891 family protein [Nannocystis sp.]
MHPRDLAPLLALGLLLAGCGDDGDATTDATTASTGQASTDDAATIPNSSTSDSPTSDATTTATTDPSTSTSDPGETTTTDSSTGAPAGPWDDFLIARDDHLRALAVPILTCIAKQDTQHPVFNGCIDWHSAVHATYALHAVSRHTGDPSYLAAAEVKLTPAGLDAELQRVQQGKIPQEVPYGYSWFLTLAVERELGTGKQDLRPLATEIRDQLRAWLESRTPPQISTGVLADDYANLSWAVLNLWQWAQWTDDAELAAAMETYAADILQDPAFDAACPFSQEETDADNFFPPCLHRARAIVTLLPGAASAPWLADWLPAEPTLTPIEMPAAAHISGLNFSRSWGLWSLYKASDDVAYRDLFYDHVTTHLNHPQYWAEDYNNYAHWVAQFGVYAISQTYAD